jgi:glycerophosphoryl diester phosphodiesterase
MLGDGAVVCLHDFDESSLSYLGKRISAETEFSEFLSLRNSMQGQVTPCTLEELEEWLIQNPTKKIVTDTKNSTLSILQRISTGLPDATNRFIPQIYQLDEYEPAERLGFQDIIFTTYRFSQLNQELINFVKDADLFAVTITSTQVPVMAESITKLGVPIYVHTVNDLFWYDRVRGWGVSNIYTDFLNATIDGY